MAAHVCNNCLPYKLSQCLRCNLATEVYTITHFTHKYCHYGTFLHLLHVLICQMDSLCKRACAGKGLQCVAAKEGGIKLEKKPSQLPALSNLQHLPLSVVAVQLFVREIK